MIYRFARLGTLLKTWIRKDAILSVSTVCALLSMIFVPPSGAYIDYIDFKVLALLFCLMTVVAGFQECGLFVFAARKLLSGNNNLRLLAWMLIMLPFFSSMVITNDVSLITFVPFAILILKMTGQKEHLAQIVVLQTIGANLGSMTTPIGNPQNLFLYGKYAIPAGSFFALLLPLTGLSFLLLTLSVLGLPKKSMEIHFEETKNTLPSPGKLLLFAFLFLLCLLSVFRLLPYEAVLGAVILSLLIFDRRLFLAADYLLLLTFVAFFIFAGNMGQIEGIERILGSMLRINPVLFSAAASQFISNVPAAVLLSGFTENWKALLVGTNLGGLGTPIASLASLISLKFYIKEMPFNTCAYLTAFTLLNIIFFIILYFSSAVSITSLS